MALDPEELKKRRQEREARRKARQARKRRLFLRLGIAAVVLVACGVLIVSFAKGRQASQPEQTQPVETDPVETQPVETQPVIEFKFNFYTDKFGNEVTLSSAGEVWYAYDGEIESDQIVWYVGNTSVATVSGSGRVKAVGKGTTTLYAEYNGQTYTCLIRCTW